MRPGQDSGEVHDDDPVEGAGAAARRNPWCWALGGHLPSLAATARSRRISGVDLARDAARAGANPPMAPALIGAALAGATPSECRVRAVGLCDLGAAYANDSDEKRVTPEKIRDLYDEGGEPS